MDMQVETAIYFRDQFRQARAHALGDAEAFQEIIFALERLGLYCTKGKAINLEGYEKRLRKLATQSCLAQNIPQEHRKWHLPFGILYKVIKTGRNDALHQGAFARHLTDHAVQLALVLEDALMSGLTRVTDYMVRDPVRAQPWQPISFVRQQMLANSYTYLPIRYATGGTQSWYLLSDYSVAHYLRSGHDEKRNERLAATVQSAVEADQLRLELAQTCLAETQVDDAMLSFENGRPILVLDGMTESNLLGILTPFDLL